MNKIFAIGDIHGCFDQLHRLIKSLAIDQQCDTLIFIGDYIDRGSSAQEVVDYVIGLRNEYKNIVCLMGNHEQMLLNYLAGIDEKMYLYNGGAATLLSYGISRSSTPKTRKAAIPPSHLLFFKSLLPYYETKDYIFVHAGLMPGLSLGEQNVHDLLWIRQEFIHSEYDFGKLVIFGHTPFGSPLIRPNKIGIDTGAVSGGRLTCVELPQVVIHQV
ncbi:MAG: serine/threonine protein phosphatase [Deltaproteobacteria bacterium HGW-Deltaproteobacteria-10]|nr:MAG: serine/threonine protein phosphatase [Deltaproteobacteria bacterium HGW-Deltaproteobacteria-10]